jgi:hypothetical protein
MQIHVSTLSAIFNTVIHKIDVFKNTVIKLTSGSEMKGYWLAKSPEKIKLFLPNACIIIINTLCP